MDRRTPPQIRTAANPDGPTLCYAAGSGVGILERDGLYFKDLEKDGRLHPYEDWRLPAAERAADLASRLSVEEIAGLMQYSMHQMVPGQGDSLAYGNVLYAGKPFQESRLPPCALSDQQIQILKDEFVRHVLVAVVRDASTSARWNNRMQAMAESLPHGIPVNISSDPRHGMDSSKEFNAGAGGDISHWPEQIGLGATFDPDLVEKFGEIAAKEYRALGIATALSPQVDLCTEPRWWRFDSCFSESPALAADMARAYCDGFQTSRGGREIADGWGYDSVNVMPKHWPGGGTGEGGRDSHFAMGRYNVYPGGNFELHQKPFTEGAFRLRGKTKCAAAVMPYYSVSYNIDRNYGENVGNSYSKYLITDLLREQYGFDGVVCTDWYITKDHKLMNQLTDGKCWGAEHLSEAERCLKIILAGVDQFGGLNEQEPVVQAYRLGAEAYGEAFMRRRFELSAKRLLTNMFRTGLFENPYLDVEATQRIVGCPDYMRKGYEAQLKSIVMLKNKDAVLPLARKTKVYIPPLYTPGHQPWIGAYAEESWKTPMDRSLVDRYFTLVDTPEEADAAICVLRQPDSAVTRFGNGYSTEDREQGGSGYVPISLQYRPYTAAYARETSIAGGDPLEDFTNRSYRGKTVMVNNERDLDVFLETKRAMGEKPVIAVLKTAAPMVVHEFEPAADAIVLSFGELYQAVLATLSGENEPSGLLPMQMPAHMRTVEEQCEDTPFDMECHRDAQGNVYDFAFGLNWDGVIEDARTAKYRPNGRSD